LVKVEDLEAHSRFPFKNEKLSYRPKLKIRQPKHEGKILMIKKLKIFP